jgi:hypothetical protein
LLVCGHVMSCKRGRNGREDKETRRRGDKETQGFAIVQVCGELIIVTNMRNTSSYV